MTISDSDHLVGQRCPTDGVLDVPKRTTALPSPSSALPAERSLSDLAMSEASDHLVGQRCPTDGVLDVPERTTALPSPSSALPAERSLSDLAMSPS